MLRPQRRAQLVEQFACAVFARARIVVAVEEGALLGDLEPCAARVEGSSSSVASETEILRSSSRIS